MYSATGSGAPTATAEFLNPQPCHHYLRLLAGARYAVNPSRKQAYSIFAAEALAMGVPAVVTPEVTKNLPDISCGIDKASTPIRTMKSYSGYLVGY